MRERESSDMAKDTDYGAFMEKFVLQQSSSPRELPLNSLTFAVKDMSVLITLFAQSYTIYLSSLSSKNPKLSFFFSSTFGLIHHFKNLVFSIFFGSVLGACRIVYSEIIKFRVRYLFFFFLNEFNYWV